MKQVLSDWEMIFSYKVSSVLFSMYNQRVKSCAQVYAFEEAMYVWLCESSKSPVPAITPH